MRTTLDTLKKGDIGVILGFDADKIPLKLVEMGCLPNNWVQVVQIAPFGDPIYLNINESYVAIRKETAQFIDIELH